MSTNDIQFTNVSLDSPSSIDNNNTQTMKRKENNNSFFKFQWFPIFMIILSFALLIICIVLSITLAMVVSKSIKIFSRSIY